MINIRDAKKEDVEEARKFLSVKELSWRGQTYSFAYFERLVNTAEGAVFLVAEENGEMVGVVYGEYSAREDWSVLMGVAVKEGFRGKGIGKALIEKFEETVRGECISMVEIDANVETLGKFIEKLGYEKGNICVNCRKMLR
ncbi:MAG: GNAT family N-acetyltransferase [Candidatus Woesearchaeota archaeon]